MPVGRGGDGGGGTSDTSFIRPQPLHRTCAAADSSALRACAMRCICGELVLNTSLFRGVRLLKDQRLLRHRCNSGIISIRSSAFGKNARLHVDGGATYAINGHFSRDSDSAWRFFVAVGTSQAEEESVIFRNDDTADVLQFGR